MTRTLFLAMLACAGLWAGPVIKVDRPSHAFGGIQPDRPVTTTFRLTNSGDAVLQVLEVVSPCECTTGRLEKPFLKPGETSDITMVFDPARDRGHISRIIQVLSSDPTTPVLDLVYTADVLLPVMATEEAVFFPDTLPSDRVVREVKVRSTLSTDLALSLQGFPPSFLKVTIAQRSKDGVLSIEMDGSKLPRQGASNGRLTFSTGIPQSPSLDLEYYAFPGRAVEAQPEGLAFDPEQPGRTQSYEVRLVHIRQRPFQVTGPPEVPAPFKVTILTTVRASEHRLVVTLEASHAHGTHRGTIRIPIDDPDLQTVEIPVTAAFGP